MASRRPRYAQEERLQESEWSAKLYGPMPPMRRRWQPAERELGEQAVAGVLARGKRPGQELGQRPQPARARVPKAEAAELPSGNHLLKILQDRTQIRPVPGLDAYPWAWIRHAPPE